jgi:hypothetical protein
MKAPKVWKWLPALLVGCTVSLSFAKLPAPPPVDPAKAAEAKQKAADTAKKARADEEAAMDRVVERYKKEKGIAVAATAKPGAPAKAAAPAPAPPAAKKK